MENEFIGNEALRARIRHQASAGTLSHCYLISGPKGAGRSRAAEMVALGHLCEADPGKRPCGVCSQCRRILHKTHPDIVTVDDPDHVTIPVSMIRDVCADAYIRPTEGRKKIYVFPHAQALSVQDQNTLLKLIEEPPDYAVFLLICESAGQLLETVQSRAQELSVSPLTEARILQALQQRFPAESGRRLEDCARHSAGCFGNALALMQTEQPPVSELTKKFAQAMGAGTASAVVEFAAGLERLPRDTMRTELAEWLELTSDALRLRFGLTASDPAAAQIASVRSSEALLQDIRALKLAMTYCESNVSSGHIAGLLAVEL